MHGDGSSETGLLLVGQSVLHQTQQTVGGAGHIDTGVITCHLVRPLVVTEMGQVHFLPSLETQIIVMHAISEEIHYLGVGHLELPLEIGRAHV